MKDRRELILTSRGWFTASNC